MIRNEENCIYIIFRHFKKKKKKKRGEGMTVQVKGKMEYTQ